MKIGYKLEITHIATEQNFEHRMILIKDIKSFQY
jgi:hypothetical protein